MSRTLLFLLLLLTASLACRAAGLDRPSTKLPSPDELSTTPLPAESQPGNFDATFISAASAPGEQNGRCHKLLRFYPDGLVLYSDNACFTPAEQAAGLADAASRWFQRENPDVTRGDYALSGQRLWLRLVAHDPLHETTALRAFQGEYCEGDMVLQEPAVLTYAGIPSDLTQPVQAYTLLAGTAPQTLSPPCHAAGFHFLWRTYITLTGAEASYRIQTDVGQSCALRYTAPGGEMWPMVETAVVTADSDGVCAWRWPVGGTPGEGIVTITLDEITQDFAIRIN